MADATPPGRPPLEQFWWLHDARWYQGVAKRFGQDVANEINAEALRFVARRVAAWYVKEYGVAPGASAAELAGVLERISRTMWPGRMLSVDSENIHDHSWETVITRNFALEMLRTAGTLDGYRCPCLDLRAGWFEGLGVRADDECLSCLRQGAPACRFRAVLSERSGEELSGGGAAGRPMAGEAVAGDPRGGD